MSDHKALDILRRVEAERLAALPPQEPPLTMERLMAQKAGKVVELPPEELTSMKSIGIARPREDFQAEPIPTPKLAATVRCHRCLDPVMSGSSVMERTDTGELPVCLPCAGRVVEVERRVSKSVQRRKRAQRPPIVDDGDAMKTPGPEHDDDHDEEEGA